MPLSDKEILAARERGDIVIEPFDERQLGTDSYDVRLGAFFYRECNYDCIYNLFERDPAAIWAPGEAAPASFRLRNRATGSMPPGWSEENRVIMLYPGETILAHTLEFIGARRNYTTQMHARSSAGRSMIGVCKCAGKGDVGFFNRWTLEITSFSRYHTIPLKVGMRIAQIDFMPVGDTLKCYGVGGSKYQESSDLQIVMASWRPEMMLPRFHADWELKNGK
jgi:dCTP deaminase